MSRPSWPPVIPTPASGQLDIGASDFAEFFGGSDGDDFMEKIGDPASFFAGMGVPAPRMGTISQARREQALRARNIFDN